MRIFVILASILISILPALGQYKIVWGDVHGHTCNSDGTGSLDDYFTFAKDIAKLDFVIVTDHDFGNGPPWRMPRETWKLTQEKADEFTTNGCFIAIAGYEWTSQPKYWTEVGPGAASERLFPGPPMNYNHKNVYFLSRLDHLFSAKDSAYNSPDLLAEAVRKQGGLIQNNHPTVDADGKDQFQYDHSFFTVIANTEMSPDVMRYNGKTYRIGVEQTVRGFLNKGGKTGFVSGTDTHEGKPAARTAVLVRELTRSAIFDALRHRRNYAVNNARIALDFSINGHIMGEEIDVKDNPVIIVDVKGTDLIEEVILIRDGLILHTVNPGTVNCRFEYTDNSFAGPSYYYVRVIQSDKDAHGNKSHAWSSPIWVKKKL